MRDDDLRNHELAAFAVFTREEEIARFADERQRSSNFARRSFCISEQEGSSRGELVFASQMSCLSEALLAPFSQPCSRSNYVVAVVSLFRGNAL